jgi:hypothetical protein
MQTVDALRTEIEEACAKPFTDVICVTGDPDDSPQIVVVFWRNERQETHAFTPEAFARLQALCAKWP